MKSEITCIRCGATDYDKEDQSDFPTGSPIKIHEMCEECSHLYISFLERKQVKYSGKKLMGEDYES